MTEPKRLAYADPPYPGQSKRLYGDHPDYAGEVDHAALIADLLARFPDGWALSTSIQALPAVLKLCPDRVRTCAWLKRATSPPMGDNRMYSWEPVILCDTPNPQMPTRMHCEANAAQYTFRAKVDGYVVGAKPQAFCFWLFEAMGLTRDDELVDLFPGSGAVSAAWDAWRAQTSMELTVPKAVRDAWGTGGAGPGRDPDDPAYRKPPTAADFDRLRDERDRWKAEYETEGAARVDWQRDALEARRVAGVLADAVTGLLNADEAAASGNSGLLAGAFDDARSALAAFDTLTEEKT